MLSSGQIFMTFNLYATNLTYQNPIWQLDLLEIPFHPELLLVVGLIQAGSPCLHLDLCMGNTNTHTNKIHLLQVKVWKYVKLLPVFRNSSQNATYMPGLWRCQTYNSNYFFIFYFWSDIIISGTFLMIMASSKTASDSGPFYYLLSDSSSFMNVSFPWLWICPKLFLTLISWPWRILQKW